MSPLLVALLLFCSCIYAGKVGVAYSVWHAAATSALQEIGKKGAPQLTIEDVILSNGQYTTNDIYARYNLSNYAQNFYFQSEPAGGPYCIYRKRPGEVGYGYPDCAGIPQTLARHASQLVAAGVDFVGTDNTNWPVKNMPGDLLSLRPTEVLFEEWSNLRRQGKPTPYITVFTNLPTGSTMWQYFLALYNNASYANMVMVDAKTGKKMWFSSLNPDANIIAAIESNGGRNDILVQQMWSDFPFEMYSQGIWSYFSPCMYNGAGSTAIVGTTCTQPVTTNSKFGTAMGISPAWQVSYGSLPGASPGKLEGLTFQTVWANVLQNQPDYVYMAGFNEWMAQPQNNPWTAIPLAFSMGLPNDPNRLNLWVDIYAWEFGRDIEPSARYGSYIYDILASCSKLYKSGHRSCNISTEICCQHRNYFSNVWSLQSTPKLGHTDFLLSTGLSEVNALIAQGTYAQICNPFGGPTVFCINMVQGHQISAPFILYSQNVGGNKIALYRCHYGGSHFISIAANCEGNENEGTLGFLAPTRGYTTLRALYRCYDKTVGAHYHSVDLPCPAADHDTGILGYVH